jgi:hypothetical protein
MRPTWANLFMDISLGLRFPLEHREITMIDKNKKEVIGYYTGDGDIYCVDCINKNIKIMKDIDKAITAEDLEESLLFCERCEKEIK